MNDLPLKRYFLDTEFIEDGRTIDLVSIGLVCSDGREYYAEVDDPPWDRASQWVLDNVRPHLTGERVRSRSEIARELLTFVAGRACRPQFWGYYADYDWVVLCQLFGPMIALPNGWPMFCMDLKQFAMTKGSPKLPDQASTEHNALNDARWNKEVWEWLRKMPNLQR